MYAIGSNGKLTIQDIGARISMTCGNMTYTVDKLEKRGWILRDRCSEDRRKIYIGFTEIGQKEWESIMSEHLIHMKEVFNDVDEEIILKTIENMKAIGKNL